MERTHESRPFRFPAVPLGRAQLSLRARALISGILFAGTFALYAKSLGFQFIAYDTGSVLLGHPKLYDETSLLRSAREILFATFPREEPLIVRDLTWAIDSRLFGLANPFGYHLGNVLINAANASLAFLMLLHATSRPLLAGSTALLFAVLPLHVQAVCWEMSRKDLLVTFFMLLGLRVQSAALLRLGTPAARRYELALVLICVLAILSKFNAVVYCLLLVLHRVMHPYLDGRLTPDAPFDARAAARTALPIALPTIAISAFLHQWYKANLTAFGVIGDRGAPTLSLEHLHTLSQYIPLTLASSLKLVFWPFDYSILYHKPNTNLAPSTAELAVAYAVCAALFLSALHFARRRKDVLFVYLSAFVLMLPYLNIEYIGYWVADRYLYLVALCPLVLCAALAIELIRRTGAARPALVAAFAALVIFLGARTFALQDNWRDNLSLWRHEVALPDPSVMSYQALAREAVRRAKRMPRGAARAAFTREARDAIARGLARYRSLPLRKTSYRQLELVQLSSMHVLLGDLAKLEGESLQVEIGHYLRAHSTAIHKRTSLALADAYMRLAGQTPVDQREAVLRESLRHFAKYVQHVSRDPAMHPQLMQMLARNYGRFPTLQPDVLALARKHLQ